jgi:transposase
VARRHGLSPQQLFGWRRQVKESQAILSEAEELRFVPAIADAASRAVRRQRKVRRCTAEPGTGMIEVEIDGAIVRIDRDADAKTIAAVLHALTASR